MKHIDKENVIVIGIALALLIAWGVWYPRHQAKVVAQAQARRAEAQVLAAKNNAAVDYAAKQAAAKEVKPAKPAPVQAKPAPEIKAVPLQKYPPVVLDNSVTSFRIDPNTGTVDRIELKQYDSSDRKSRIVYSSEQVPAKLSRSKGWNSGRPSICPSCVRKTLPRPFPLSAVSAAAAMN